MTQKLNVKESNFEELVLASSIKTPGSPELPTLDCESDWHEDVSDSRKLREGQRVIALLYRTDKSNAWTIETVRCVRCGSSFPSYEGVLVPESEVAVVSGTLETTENEQALQLINTQCIEAYVVGEPEAEVQTEKQQEDSMVQSSQKSQFDT